MSVWAPAWTLVVLVRSCTRNRLKGWALQSQVVTGLCDQ
jgi:hypothetical protein